MIRTLLVSLLALSLSAATTTPRWIGWTVPVHGMYIGNDCTLEHDGFSIEHGSHRESDAALIAVRLDGDRLEKLRMFDGRCTVAGVTMTTKTPAESVAWLAAHATDEHVVMAIALHDTPEVVPLLERFAGRDHGEKMREQALFWLGQRGGERGFRYLRDFVRSEESETLRKRAVFALSQSKADDATAELIDLARHGDHDVRREAVFWLGQRAGEKAAGELRRIADDDPDDDVREHAVFAISQLPRERSVPLLIELVKTHKSARVRKRAMFWLAQTDDPRAVALIEEILGR